MLLATIGFILGWLSRTGEPPSVLRSIQGTALLALFVSRGGRISRMLLIIGSVAYCAVAVLTVARSWGPAAIALVLISVVQVVLLASPPVYGRTRPVPIEVRAPGWSQLVRRPPAWLLPWGLLAGVLLTLAFLGNMDFVAIAGCQPAASDACHTLAEGYPLHWLSAYQGNPDIWKGGLLRDGTQWSLATTALLYLAWLYLTAPADRPE
jgi:hypothetical protein